LDSESSTKQQAYRLVHGHSCLFIRSKLEAIPLEEDVIRGQKHATWSEIVPADPVRFLIDLDQAPPHRGEITTASHQRVVHLGDALPAEHIMVCAHGTIGTSSAPAVTRRYSG